MYDSALDDTSPPTQATSDNGEQSTSTRHLPDEITGAISACASAIKAMLRWGGISAQTCAEVLCREAISKHRLACPMTVATLAQQVVRLLEESEEQSEEHDIGNKLRKDLTRSASAALDPRFMLWTLDAISRALHTTGCQVTPFTLAWVRKTYLVRVISAISFGKGPT
ncbi:hypothetical protein DFP72DRAFT_855436 [Ephemerocybe angulata]|uniref:Uncharacterized protein n=1 Tax=Ephemerocybe angulata TaxID=980116 RepID=A0A8H6HGI0_9AGAR|nr:hypothetical protein DFP72DRAFT_855436 [Tulosesus angulatus]